MLHTKFHPPEGSGATPPAALTVEELSAIGALDEIHPVDAAHMIAGGLVAMGDEAMTLAFSRGKGLGLATALVALSLNTGTTLEQLREQGASVKEQQKAGIDLFQRAATLASSSALTAHDRVVALLTLHTILNSASAALVILRQARDEHDGAQVRDISPEDMARIATCLRENRDRIDAMMGETIVDLAAKHGMTAEDIDEIIATLTTDHPKKEHS